MRKTFIVIKSTRYLSIIHRNVTRLWKICEFLKKKFSEAMKEIIKAYLLIYQNTCSTSESSKKVLYGIFIVYAITCIKLRSDAALSKLKPKAGLLACLWQQKWSVRLSRTATTHSIHYQPQCFYSTWFISQSWPRTQN